MAPLIVPSMAAGRSGTNEIACRHAFASGSAGLAHMTASVSNGSKGA